MKPASSVKTASASAARRVQNAEQQREAAAELDQDGQRRDDRRHRQALGADVAGGAVEAADLGEAGEDEDQGEQDAADEDGGVLERLVFMVMSAVEVMKGSDSGEVEDQHLGVARRRPIDERGSRRRGAAHRRPTSRWPLTSTLPRTTCT